MGVEVDAYRAQSNALSKAFKEPPTKGLGRFGSWAVEPAHRYLDHIQTVIGHKTKVILRYASVPTLLQVAVEFSVIIFYLLRLLDY